jgi:hypothetical protein
MTVVASGSFTMAWAWAASASAVVKLGAAFSNASFGVVPRSQSESFAATS